MKFRVSCFVDLKDLASFVELMAPYGQVIIHPVDSPQPIVSKPKPLPKPGLGTRGPKTGAVIAISAAVNMHGLTGKQLKKVFSENNLRPDGAGATLSKLGKRGYVRNTGGLWTATAKGEALAKRWATKDKETHEHAD